MKKCAHIACGMVALLWVASGLASDAGASSRAFKGPINATVADKESMVIIFPTKEADEHVMAGIRAHAESIRDRLFSEETPVISDEEALKRDLSSNSLLVYGTPAGNLWLAKHLEMLAVRVESDRVVADTTYDGTGLCFISCWPNPYNPSKGMVIYTAQQAKDVININEVFHGPNDYVVARGTAILGTGNYHKENGGWSLPVAGGGPGVPQLPLDEALEDLDFFFRTVEGVHPQPLAFVSPQDYLELKRRSRATLAESADEEGRVSKSTVALVVAEAAAFYGDGHTSSFLSPGLIDWGDTSKRMLPFRVEYRYGEIVIAETVKDLVHLKGRKLLKAEGVDFVEFIDPILNKISGERKEFRIAVFISNQRVYWALIPLTKGPEVVLEVQGDDGQTESVSARLVSLEEYEKMPTRQRRRGRDLVEFHHDDQTCYWRYNSFIYSEGEKKRIDSVFAAIREKGAKNLIVDLRFNGGGNSQAGEYIMNYLTSKPYYMVGRIDIKLSKQGFDEHWLEKRLAELAGLTITQRDIMGQPEDKGYRFEGRLFLLTGPNTFSSAVLGAAIVKDNRLGTIIGEETGGLRECFGDQRSFLLPNSGLRFGVSYKRFYAPVPKAGDDRSGVVPDVQVNEDVLSLYLGADDPVLAFALDYVKEQ